MTVPNFNNVHNKFRLNGYQLDRDALCENAYSFIKEGEPYEKALGDFLLDWFDAKSFIEMTTSGTTGPPKIIRIDKQAMVNSALATGDFFDLSPGDKTLHCLPTKFIAGKMMFVRGFILGLDMDFVAPSLNPLEKNTVCYDFAAMVPLQAQYSFKGLSKIKKLIIGGARVSKALEAKLIKLPIDVYETYGMTETITHIAAKKLGEDYFTVLPHVTISYDDKQCLMIKAPRISNDVIVTNDLVELINENQFKFLGRIDNVINSGGIKLIPEKIEEKLSEVILNRFFVAGLPDDKLGEKLILVVEGQQYEIPELTFAKLDKYERPKEVYFVQNLLETPTGKVLRKETLKKLKLKTK